ncbi:hypothetical protein ACFL5H_02375 [Candidatus Latescibacterota bacterium]
MVRNKRLCTTTVVTAGILIMMFASSSFGQLLFRQGMEEESYARTGYTQYGQTQVSRSSNPRYDYFGNYILTGVQLFNWQEAKLNSRHADIAEDNNSSLEKLNLVDENPYYHLFLDGLVVMNESTRSFSTRLIVGNNVRLKFSPLTLDMLNLNGIRWDFLFAGNELTLISSRANMPVFTYIEAAGAKVIPQIAPVYLQGAHIQRRMGIFDVSANYVNTYRSNSAISRSNNSMTGTLLHEEKLKEFRPVQFAVKVEDGSRYDGGGPRVYDIFPVINGKIRRDMFVGVTKGNWKDDFNVHRRTNDPNTDQDQNRYFLDPLRIPEFYEINNVASKADIKGNIIARRLPDPATQTYDDPSTFIDFRQLNSEGNPYLECNGEDYYIYWFNLPQDEEAQEVVFKALVSNNYIFSISEIHSNRDSDIPEPKHIDRSQATFFEKVCYSKGDVKDESNLGWVSFEYGIPMANMLMSFRVESDVQGFKFTTEYARNLQFKQFPNNSSSKFRKDAEAYYLTVTREFGNLSLGGEYFKMDPDYTTTFVQHDPRLREVDDIFGPGLYTDSIYANNKETNGGTQSVLNTTHLISTVVDNDDRDQYPDYHMFRYMRDTNGVFPGLDINGNHRPDVNENDNLRPDYDEPFFLFNVDPDEYDYGLDMNNNNTIDIRENDSKPDYPYDVDRKGFHVYGSYGQDMGWKYTLGYINMEKIVHGGSTDVKYGIADYNRFIPFFADLRFSTVFKQVEDTIQDDVFRYARRLSTTLVDSLTYAYNSYSADPQLDEYKIIDDNIADNYYDPLEYKDSYVSKSFFEMNIFSVPNLTIGVKLKYEINHQNETSIQKENDIIDRTQIYRAEYRYYLGDLLIQPQVKFQNRKYTNHDGFTRILHEQYFYPILRVEYPLTVRTSFRAGAQGFPGLNATVRNLMNDQLNYDSRDYVVMLSNMSVYSGYDFSLNFGFQTRWQSFNGIARQAYSRTDKFYFVRLVVGLEPIS